MYYYKLGRAAQQQRSNTQSARHTASVGRRIGEQQQPSELKKELTEALFACHIGLADGVIENLCQVDSLSNNR